MALRRRGVRGSFGYFEPCRWRLTAFALDEGFEPMRQAQVKPVSRRRTLIAKSPAMQRHEAGLIILCPVTPG